MNLQQHFPPLDFYFFLSNLRCDDKLVVILPADFPVDRLLLASFWLWLDLASASLVDSAFKWDRLDMSDANLVSGI